MLTVCDSESVYCELEVLVGMRQFAT
jgi:hypothetical protein